MAEEDKDKAEGKSKKKLLVIIGIVVFLLLLGGGGAAYYFMSSGDENKEVVEEPKIPEKAIYVKLRTPEGRKMYITQLKTSGDRARMMQIYSEAKVRTQEGVDALNLHMPLIISRLNTLFSTQSFDVINTYEGKEQLKKSATRAVQQVLLEKEGLDAVEEVIFTDFVIQ